MAITFLCFYFNPLISAAFSSMKNNFLNEIFAGITFVSSEIIIFFFLTSIFLWKEHKRKWVFPLWLTLGFSALVSFLLKIIVQKQRPFQTGIASISPFLESASYYTWNFSFPSFQSMLGFCAVPILSKEFPKLKFFWVCFAILIALSRVYFGLHFFSDVLIGGIIGYLIGTIVIELEKKYSFGEKIYKNFLDKF